MCWTLLCSVRGIWHDSGRHGTYAISHCAHCDGCSLRVGRAVCIVIPVVLFPLHVRSARMSPDAPDARIWRAVQPGCAQFWRNGVHLLRSRLRLIARVAISTPRAWEGSVQCSSAEPWHPVCSPEWSHARSSDRMTGAGGCAPYTRYVLWEVRLMTCLVRWPPVVLWCRLWPTAVRCS